MPELRDIDSSITAPRTRLGRQSMVTTALGALAIVGLAFAVKIIGNAPEVDQGRQLMAGLPPAAVFVQHVEQHPTYATATVTGTLRAVARAEVAAREAGAILAVSVDEGDSVDEGTVLATLDDRRAMALLTEAQASLTAAKSLVLQRDAELARAVDDLRMKEGLHQRKAVSKSDILDAERALAVAQAQHDVAREGVEEVANQVAYLEVQTQDMVIRAPFAGVVVERQVELGEWVDAGSVIATLVKTNPVEAWLRVPTRYLKGVQGSPDNLLVQQSATRSLHHPIKVTALPDVEPLSQLFTVVATLDNHDQQLTPGESVTGMVPVSLQSPHWQFPTDALIRTPLGDFVYGVAEDETAKRIPVTVAFEREGLAFVPVDGSVLQIADRLVIEGNERLQPGQALIIRERSGTVESSAP